MIHGSGVTYRKGGCRCDDCKAAAARDQADYRKRRYLARGSTLADPTGTSRRLQALAVMGWGIRDIGERLGIQPSVVGRLRAAEHRPLRRTAEAVAELYDELSMTRGPSPKARTWALRRGWLPPLAWDAIDDPESWADLGGEDDIADEVVVQRLIAGGDWRELNATRADRIAAAARLSGTHHKRLGLRSTDCLAAAS